MQILPGLGFRGDTNLSRGQTAGLGHLHLDVELNLAERQPARYLLAGRVHEVPSGQLFAFWAGNPHHLLEYPAGEAVLLHWVTVPLGWLQEWGFDPRFLGALLAGDLIATDHRGDDAARMAEWVALSRDPDDGRLIALHEIHARLRRMQRAWLGGERAAAREGEALPQPVLRMLEALIAHYREEVDVDAIAAAAGLHPNYAMGLFKRSCGHTIHQYLTELRLAHAQRLLITGDDAITELALDAGFPSLSRFYACFKRRWGITPSAYRERYGA